MTAQRWILADAHLLWVLVPVFVVWLGMRLLLAYLGRRGLDAPINVWTLPRVDGGSAQKP